MKGEAQQSAFLARQPARSDWLSGWGLEGGRGGSGCEELALHSLAAGSSSRDQRLPKSLLLGLVAAEPKLRGPSTQQGWHLGEKGAQSPCPTAAML